jgi:type IV fimbrial biogenesis protein FimT
MVTTSPMTLPGRRGFTLVEAIVVIALIAIVIGLAAPGLSGMIITQQLKNASFDLASSLSLARSEALTRNVEVTIAPTLEDWARGWAVKDAGGTVIREQVGYGRIAISGPVRVSFTGDGRSATAMSPFAVTSSEADAAFYRCVRLRVNGRAYVSKGACS